MEIIIRRGTHQIGGCITEIKTEKTRIFIDFGEELPDENGETAAYDTSSFVNEKESCDGVFFTHYHGDHVGMFEKLPESVPLYIGHVAKEIYLCLQKRVNINKPNFDKKIRRIESMLELEPNTPIFINDIKVTPYTVDHSAYDAYMFLIEAEGKRILYTGDFRTHGLEGELILKVIDRYIKSVDLLICEGTMLSRSEAEQNIKTEYELAEEFNEYMKKYKYVFIMCSSTNIERIAAAYNVYTKKWRENKYFLCDSFQHDILKIVSESKKPNRLSYYDCLDKIRIYKEEYIDKLKEKGGCMLIRLNDLFPKAVEKFDKNESIILYSLWKGYLKNNDDHYKKLLDNYKWEYWHTSGHATAEAIKKVCNAVKPSIGVLPIHTEAPEKFGEVVAPYKVITAEDNVPIKI